MKRLKISSVRYSEATGSMYRVLGNGPHRVIRERDYRKLIRVVNAARRVCAEGGNPIHYDEVPGLRDAIDAAKGGE